MCYIVFILNKRGKVMKTLNINELRDVLAKRFGAKAFYSELEIEKALEKMSDKGWRDYREETAKPVSSRSFNFHDFIEQHQKQDVTLDEFISQLHSSLQKELQAKGFDLDEKMTFAPHFFHARDLGISQSYEGTEIQKETHREFLARVQTMLREAVAA